MTPIRPVTLPEMFPPNPIWRDLRHIALGLGLGLSIMVYVVAGADEEVQPLTPLSEKEVEEVLMSIGAHECRDNDGIAGVTDLNPGWHRFRCRNGTIIIREYQLKEEWNIQEVTQ